jgi:Mg-chelatase subunit ChlD
MTFLHPIYLLLAVPLAMSLLTWGFRARWLMALRVVTLLLVILALAGLTVRLPSRAGTVVVVADRSLSMPVDAEGHQKEAITLLQNSLGPNDRLAVVSFGQAPAVELAPGSGKFAGFAHEVGRHGSNLAEAMQTALALIPADSPGRLLLLSDGLWTGREPSNVAAGAAGRGVAIDYRCLERPQAADVAVARLDAPSSIGPGESFLITAWVQAPARQEVAFDFRRDGRRIAGGTRLLEPGLNRLTFRDQAGEPGTQSYLLTVAAKGNDPVPENNQARLLVGVHGQRPVLVATSTPTAGYAGLLEQGGVKVKSASPDQCAWTLEELSKYSSVILENVPADAIGHQGMETLAAWVEQTGAGLMMTGGRNSYGPGGYFKSPLEPIMPVSMELRQEHRKLSLAIVVALDRSNSMSMLVGGGRVKMDLANLGTVQVLDLLAPGDELGVIAIDTEPHVIQELGVIANKAPIRDRILRINSQGGGIFVDVALAASYKMLQSAKSGTRHIILFADAADAEQPGAYRELIATARAENITVSVIGLGKESDKDGELLKDIAARGGGRVFFTDRPEDLPRLFAQDTFVVARSSFLDEPTPIKTTPGLLTLAGRDFTPPALGGYNLCYLRPSANLATVTLDEYSAPVVASWQAGAGRVLCFTGEADGKYTGAIGGWKDLGDFHASLARWVAGRTAGLPKGMVLTQQVKQGIATVRLHLDPEREAEPFSATPNAVTLRAIADKKPRIEKSRLHWIGPDTLLAEVALQGTETALTTVDIPGHGPAALPPVCLMYSPEFEPQIALASSMLGRDSSSVLPSETGHTGRGLAALERLARSTGGKERIDLSGTWKDIPKRPRFISLAAWLLCAAVITFLVEVLERLTGMVSRGRRLIGRAPPLVAPSSVSTTSTAPAAAPSDVAAPATVTSHSAAQVSGVLEALRQVQKRRNKP